MTRKMQIVIGGLIAIALVGAWLSRSRTEASDTAGGANPSSEVIAAVVRVQRGTIEKHTHHCRCLQAISGSGRARQGRGIHPEDLCGCR